MRRSASVFGLLSLVFLAFGLGALVLLQTLADWYVLLNLIAGIGLLIVYLTSAFENLREMVGSRSTRYGTSAAAYTLLFLALVVGLNFVLYRHHHQWDTTEAGVYTLSPQSRKVVEGLSQDLDMTAFVEAGQNPVLQSLLDSYRYAGPEHVKTRLVDPDKEPALVDQMKITTAPSVHLQYGKESFVVTQPTEEAITNGVIRVSGATKKTVYFTDGDGEADVKDQQEPKGYASAKLALEQENYEVKSVVLPAAEQIPDDASVLVIAGPSRPLDEHSIGAVDAYLKRGGRLLTLLGPRDGGEGLPKLLGEWGVKVGNDIVIDREMRLFSGPSLGINPLANTYGTHPITANFKDYTQYPQVRTIEPDATNKKGLQATALVKTSPSSRALTKVDELFTKGTATVDDSDRKGPLSVVVAVEAKLKELGITPAAASEGKPAADVARLVVFGSSLFADNQQMAPGQSLNRDLFLNAVGWLVGQESVVSIRSRNVRASRAELTRQQAVQIFYLSVLIVPELLIAAGIAIWWRRRSE